MIDTHDFNKLINDAFPHAKEIALVLRAQAKEGRDLRWLLPTLVISQREAGAIIALERIRSSKTLADTTMGAAKRGH